MLEILTTSINAVVPIILLIMLGYLLKRMKFLNANFVKIGNKFVFKICLPCMLFINIYDKMESFADIRWDVVLYTLAIIALIFALGLLTAILSTKENKRRGVILQCTFRSNFAIIGLTLVERLGGDLGVASIVSAFSIPVFNILAVIALSLFVGKEENENAKREEAGLPVPLNNAPLSDSTTSIDGGNGVQAGGTAVKKNGQSVKDILLNIVKNPLIIGCVLGLVCVGIRELERAVCGGEVVFRLDNQLKFLYIGLSDLKAIASPLALVVLGGQFEFSAVKGMTKEIVVATAWRIVIAPVIGIGIALLLSNYTSLLNFGPDIYPTLIALFGTPVAVSSAIMAGGMNNDEQLATQLVVWTSILSIVTIFLTVFLLMSLGLLVV